ncbi:MAG: substrate-binding domain-containing protein [Polyangiaceae bacterium]
MATVAEVRRSRGISQAALAAQVGISRQALGAVEAGRATPGVDVALRLAGALDCSVEALFGEPPRADTLDAEWVGTGSDPRVALARLAERWVCYPLTDTVATAADALVERRHERNARVLPLRSTRDAADSLVVMGCAGAFGTLAERVNSRSDGGRLLWVSASSTRALEALAAQQTHVAGVHLQDGKSGSQNVADVARITAGTRGISVVTLGSWRLGLVTARDNPRALRGLRDLAQRGLRIATREVGSGARRSLDRELRRAGLLRKVQANVVLCARSHAQVATAVELGAVDVGIATEDAARVHGLGFVPLETERYDLAFPTELQHDLRLQRMIDMLTAAPMRRELSALGYDLRDAGTRVAVLEGS